MGSDTFMFSNIYRVGDILHISGMPLIVTLE